MPANANHLEQYYRLSDPSASITAFDPLTDGWENEVYAFTLETGSVSRTLILRIYPGNRSHVKAGREYRGMKALHEVGYPVPEVLALETDDRHFGKPFIIMERAAGTSMDSLLRAATPAQAETYLRQFCALFVRLHQIDPQRFTSGDTGNINQPMLQQYRARLTLITPVLDWAESQPEALVCPVPAVVHQDFHPGNILYNAGQLTVIDWTNINVLDPRIDLAWTLMLLGSFESWDLRNLILRFYEEALGRPVAHIEVFESLACARRLHEFVGSVQDGAQTMGMRPETAAVMRSQRRHYERVYARLQTLTGLSIREIEAALR